MPKSSRLCPGRRTVSFVSCAVFAGAGLTCLQGQDREGAIQRVIVSAPPALDPGNTLLSGDEIDLSDARTIGRRVSNLNVNDAGANSFTDVYSLRGLNNTPNFSKQALVFYVDGVPSSSTFTNPTELGQIDQMEIFRGPQGDVFGKNSEAGVVDVRTVAPDNTHRFRFATGFGDYNLWSAEILALGPLVRDVVFFKLEGSYVSRDGYLENTFRGTRPDYQQHAFGRALLRLKPSSEWQVDFSAEMHDARDGVQRFVPLAGDPFKVAFDFDGRTNIRSDAEAARISHTGDSGTLTLITSRRDWNLQPYEADFDYSPEPFVRGRFDLRQNQVGQEIRFESPAANADWKWTAGLFADRITTSGSELFASGDFAKLIAFDETEWEFALFGNATRKIAGPFAVTVGMRIEHSSDEIDRRRDVSFETPSAFRSSRTQWNGQPKVRLEYRWSDTDVAYVSSALGYKNGGFSFLETDPRFAAFETERAWTNEVGVRKSWAADRFQSRAAFFFNRVEDYQVERLAVPPDITVFNAPLVTAWGAEVDATARLSKQFELIGTFGYTHSEFREFRDPITGEDFRGKRTPFAPEFTASMRMRYKTSAGVFGQVELLAAGETFYDEANTPFLRQAPHGQVNVKIGYEAARFSVNAYCDNLNDARYFTQKIGYAGIGTPGAPRTVGAMLVIKL